MASNSTNTPKNCPDESDGHAAVEHALSVLATTASVNPNSILSLRRAWTSYIDAPTNVLSENGQASAAQNPTVSLPKLQSRRHSVDSEADSYRRSSHQGSPVDVRHPAYSMPGIRDEDLRPIARFEDTEDSGGPASPRQPKPAPGARPLRQPRRSHFTPDEVVAIFRRRPDIRAMLTGERMRRAFTARSKQVREGRGPGGHNRLLLQIHRRVRVGAASAFPFTGPRSGHWSAAAALIMIRAATAAPIRALAARPGRCHSAAGRRTAPLYSS